MTTSNEDDKSPTPIIGALAQQVLELQLVQQVTQAGGAEFASDAERRYRQLPTLQAAPQVARAWGAPRRCAQTSPGSGRRS